MEAYRQDLNRRNREVVSRHVERIRRFRDILAFGEQNPEREAQFHAQLVGECADYVGFRFSPEDRENLPAMEREYHRIEASISRAQSSLAQFAHDISLVDLAQGISPVNEIARVNDPALLLSAMLGAKSGRVSFEARRALWMGSMFWRFEHEIGRTDELQDALRGLEFFLDAHFEMDSAPQPVHIFHHMSVDEEGVPHVGDFRVPVIDGSHPERINGENMVYLSMRSMPHPTRPGERIFFTIDGRPKSRLSAIMKTIRKAEGFHNLKDILGVTITVHQRFGDELQCVVDKLDELFEADTDDRLVHPLRGQGSMGTTNVDSDAFFQPEKFTTTWSMDRTREVEEQFASSLRKVFPSPLAYNRFDTVRRKMSGRQFPLEVQVMTLQDMALSKLVDADVNHAIYEARRVTRPMTGDVNGTSTVELLFPQEFYGVDWRAENIQKAIRAKRLAGLGLTRRVMDQIEGRS